MGSEFCRNIAIVIGINDYGGGIPLLTTPVNDATVIAEKLEREHHYQVRLLLDKQATQEAILELFEESLPREIEADDRLLFYFAGHGIALDGEDGPSGYLIPQDARLGQTRGFLPMPHLREAVSALPCRHFLGILDCCFAGAFRWSSTRDLSAVPEVIHQECYERFIAEPAWQVITSTAHDQKALDVFGQLRASGTHSPFATALIEALQGEADAYPPARDGAPPGDGVITATELYLYLRDRVEAIAGGAGNGQTPGIWPLPKHDKGEYIFFNPQVSPQLPPAPPLNESLNPYRGLQAFEEEHRDLFFGRGQLIKKLAGFVREQPLTVVLGASGRGKSSLVKAGLIPYVKSPEREGETWRILPPFRPGEFPLKAIEYAIEREFGEGDVFTTLASFCRQNPTVTILLTIDQCEELITLCGEEREREGFLRLLGKIISGFPERARVLLTLRSDFEPQFQDSSLRNYWKAARFVIPAMNRSQLREAIEEPARTRVLYFQSDDPKHPLIDQLIDEVIDMPGGLPLLSFTLSELYLKYLQRQEKAQQRGETLDRAITEADYNQLGGVIRSLTGRADREFEALVNEDPAYEPIIERVMLRMVVIGGGQSARRRVSLSELTYSGENNERAREMIRRFCQARLLVQGRDPDGDLYVEPAHDALIASWPRLLVWRRTTRTALAIQRRLTPAALEWKRQSIEGKQPDRFLWDSNPALDYLELVLKSTDNWFNAVEEEFVRRSLGKKRRNQVIRWALTGAVVLGSLVFSAMVWLEREQSEYNLAESLARFSASELDSHQELSALIAAIRAGKILRHQGKTSPIVNEALQSALYWVRETNRLIGHRDTIASLLFTDDGQTIISGSSDGTIKLWNRTGKLLRTLSGGSNGINSLAITPDGQQIVAGNEEGAIEIWTVGGSLRRRFIAHSDRVTSVAIAPDGERILSASRDGTVKLWNFTGKPLKTFPTQAESVNSVRFSPDGKAIAYGGDTGALYLYDLQGQLRHTLTGHRGLLRAIAFSPDGTRLVSGGDDGIIKIWNPDNGRLESSADNRHPVGSIVFQPDGSAFAVEGEDGGVKLWNLNGRLLNTFRGHTGSVNAAAFSPDGQTLISGGEDQEIKVWSLENPLVRSLIGTSSFNGVAYRPDGKQLAGAGFDARIWLWSDRGVPQTPLSGHEDAINDLIYSPDGKILASASSDRTVRLWEAGKLRHTMNGHRGEVWDLDFSPDGKILASSSEDRTIKLWDRQGNLLKTLSGHKKGVNSVAFSQDSRFLASASGDGSIKLWTRQGKLIWTLLAHKGAVWAVIFSPDGTQIASASSYKDVKFWNLDGQLLHVLEGHIGGIWTLAFTDDGKYLASVSTDKTVKLWKPDGTLWRTLEGNSQAVYGVDFSPDGQFLASAGDDGRILLWKLSELSLDWQVWLKLNCQRARNYLQHSNDELARDNRHLCDGILTP